jgi:hypothetical protein
LIGRTCFHGGRRLSQRCCDLSEGRRYVFVGLERVGGVLAYDITDPNAPVFVDYVNNRDFSVIDLTSPEAGDLGPEGVLFITAHDSPTASAAAGSQQ